MSISRAKVLLSNRETVPVCNTGRWSGLTLQDLKIFRCRRIRTDAHDDMKSSLRERQMNVPHQYMMQNTWMSYTPLIHDADHLDVLSKQGWQSRCLEIGKCLTRVISSTYLLYLGEVHKYCLSDFVFVVKEERELLLIVTNRPEDCCRKWQWLELFFRWFCNLYMCREVDMAFI